MKRIVFILLVFVILFACHYANGQQDPMYSQYMFNMLSVNPAYAGSRDVLSATALYRKQWVGIEGAPETVTFSMDTPVKGRKIGLGLNIVDDRIGIVHNLMMNGCYAYRVQLSSKGTLSLGLQVGINQYKADYGSVQLSQNDLLMPDNAFSGSINRIYPNFGFGAYYTSDKFYVGFAAPKLVKNNLSGKYDPTLDFSSFRNRYNRHFFVTTGYVFDVGSSMKLKPSLLLKGVHGAPIELDINVNVWFHDVVAIGGSYRTGDSFSMLLEFQATPKFRFGYAYDLTVSGLSGNNNGSHEIMLRYEFGYAKSKILSPRYF